MHARLTQREDIRPHTLRWAEDRPLRTSSHESGRAQLAEERRLLLVQRRLQRHERHEATGLRVVQRRQAVLIDRIHIDAERGELPDDLSEALTDGIVQRRAAANL